MEADDEGDGEPNEDRTTWREFVFVLLTLLLDMESSLAGLSSYRGDNRQMSQSILQFFFSNSIK